MKEAFWGGFEKQAFKSMKHLMTDHQLKEVIHQNANQGIGFIGDAALRVLRAAGVINKRQAVKFTKAVQRPALELDTVAGHIADKAINALPKFMPGKNWFKMEEKARAGKNMYETFHRPSAVAPLYKTMEVAKPIIVAGAITKGIDEYRKRKNEQQYTY